MQHKRMNDIERMKKGKQYKRKQKCMKFVKKKFRSILEICRKGKALRNDVITKRKLGKKNKKKYKNRGEIIINNTKLYDYMTMVKTCYQFRPVS